MNQMLLSPKPEHLKRLANYLTSKNFIKIHISTLPIKKGEHTASALARTVKIARHVEKLDFKRIWVAEHHNMEYIASSATSLLIQHIASNTSSIRVGSGGIMLPNHAPLVIAEQFGTLET
jgi:luciferase family oxidoreductase group 1